MDGSSKFVKGDAIAGAANPRRQHHRRLLPWYDQPRPVSRARRRSVYVTLAVGRCAGGAQYPPCSSPSPPPSLSPASAIRSDLSGQIGGQFADPRSWLPVAVRTAVRWVAFPAMPQTIFLPAGGARLLALPHAEEAGRARPAPVEEAGSAVIARGDRYRGGERPDTRHHRTWLWPRPPGRTKHAARRWWRGSPEFASSCRRSSALLSRASACATAFGIAPNDYRVLLGGMADR